jgi:hypothetical protein
MITVDEFFAAEIDSITRLPNLSAYDRAARIAASIKPSAISLELRAELRKKLKIICRYGNPNADVIDIIRKGFDLSNEFNRVITHLKLERSNGSRIERKEVPVFGDFNKICEKIEIEIDGKVIYTETMPSWGHKAFSAPRPIISSADRRFVFAREIGWPDSEIEAD